MLPSCGQPHAYAQAQAGCRRSPALGRAAHLLQAEEVRAVLGVIEREARGLVERDGARVGLAVGRVALVDLKGLELVLVLLRHGVHLLCREDGGTQLPEPTLEKDSRWRSTVATVSSGSGGHGGDERGPEE